MKKVLWLLSFILLFSNCKKSEAPIDIGNSDSKIMAVKLPPKVDQVKFVKPVLAKDEDVTGQKSTIEQKIIKEGDLKFETNDLAATYAQIQEAVKKNKAIIQNDTEGKDYCSLFRKLIIRIPSQNFDLFIQDISKGVSYFDNKEISSQDVTEEYIDIDARLKAKKVLESRYLELLKKANKVSEMLEIEGQLSSIREEIEAKEGQLRYMQSRISMSTISIEFYKTVAKKQGITTSYGTKIWNAISSGFNGLSSFFIGVVSIWPFLITIVLILYFIKKRLKKKNT
jgi:hypothetical protein